MKTRTAFKLAWKEDRRWLVETSIWGLLSVITFGFFLMAVVHNMDMEYFAPAWILNNFTGFVFWYKISRALEW